MNISIETNFNKITSYHEKWNTLCAKNTTNTIFQTFEWNKVWWDVFGKENELYVIFAKDGNDLVGVAPLMVRSERKWNLKRRVITFIGDGASDYSDFVIYNGRSDILLALVKYILGRCDEWDEIRLLNFPEHSKTIKIIYDVCNLKNLNIIMDGNTHCPTLLIKDNIDYARKVSNKKSLRRHHKYFVRQGQYEVLHLADRLDINLYLEAFFNQHINRWIGSKSPSLFEDKINKILFRQLTDELTKNKWIVFTVIKSKDVPIAFHFGFDYNNKFIWYKPSFEKSLSKYSPGEVLLKELLEYAIESKKDEFDFTVGKEPFKLRFSNKIRHNYNLKIFKSKVDFKIEKGIYYIKQLLNSGRKKVIASSIIP